MKMTVAILWVATLSILLVEARGGGVGLLRRTEQQRDHQEEGFDSRNHHHQEEEEGRRGLLPPRTQKEPSQIRRTTRNLHDRQTNEVVATRQQQERTMMGSSSSMVMGEARIVGGDEISKLRYPYLVAFFKRFSPDLLVHRCGGVLVAPNLVLSAAHCHDKADIVRIGDHAIDDTGDDTNVEVFNVTSHVKHPLFDYYSLNYDAALYVLNGTSSFPPVRINFDESVPAFTEALYVLGWGFTKFGGLPSSVPREATVKALDNYLCNDAYSANGGGGYFDSSDRITDAMLCAASTGQDACQGDSGGPLLKTGDDVSGDVIVGVISWGFGCADPEYPGVYTRVSMIADWIHETVCNMTSISINNGNCSSSVVTTTTTLPSADEKGGNNDTSLDTAISRGLP